MSTSRLFKYSVLSTRSKTCSIRLRLGLMLKDFTLLRTKTVMPFINGNHVAVKMIKKQNIFITKCYADYADVNVITNFRWKNTKIIV